MVVHNDAPCLCPTSMVWLALLHKAMRLHIGGGPGAARISQGEIWGFCYNWQYSYLRTERFGAWCWCSVCLLLQHAMYIFFKPEHIQPWLCRVSGPLCGPSGSLLVVKRPRCSLLQPRTPWSLKLSTSTCTKEMWRVVLDLEDRCTDLSHSSMHKFVGRPISQTGKGTRMYHHNSYSESKSKCYRKL